MNIFIRMAIFMQLFMLCSRKASDNSVIRMQTEFETERASLREEMKQLQELYESELENLRKQLQQQEFQAEEQIAQQQQLKEVRLPNIMMLITFISPSRLTPVIIHSLRMSDLTIYLSLL